LGIYDKLCICDIYLFLAHSRGWARDQKEVINMNKYEIAVILNVNLEEEARTATIEKVKGYITRFGGTVTEVEDWGKKRLAYEIQKSKEAFYYFVKFESNSECPNEVEARVRLMENVVRYLVVKQEA